jgi:hypothetical protein
MFSFLAGWLMSSAFSGGFDIRLFPEQEGAERSFPYEEKFPDQLASHKSFKDHWLRCKINKWLYVTKPKCTVAGCRATDPTFHATRLSVLDHGALYEVEAQDTEGHIILFAFPSDVFEKKFERNSRVTNTENYQ